MEANVLIVLPCLLVGGTEMHTLALARALASAKYRVTVCAYFEHDPMMVEQFHFAGIATRLLGMCRRGTGRNFWQMPRLAWALAGVMREEQPDFIHVQYMAPGLIPVLVARFLGRGPVLVSVHVPGHHYGTRLWLPRSVVARIADAFLCVSFAAERSFFGDSAMFQERLLRRGRKHFTIHNAVELAEIPRHDASSDSEYLRRRLGVQGRLIVGMVSRLSPEKGPQHLIEAAAEIFRNVPSACLLIVGDGHMRHELEGRADQLDISNRIIWTGRLAKQDVYRHLELMDVVVVPSHFEGFGLAAIEAMALSKPVVASDIDALREVVADEETGLLVPPQDAAALASALIRLLKDPAACQRMGTAGRVRVERNFSMDLFADRHLRLYAALAKRQDGAWPAKPVDQKAGCTV